MASIIKRRKKYSVVYTYTDEHGEKKQKWETYGSLAEAKKRKAKVEYEQDNQVFVPPPVKTVSELLQEFFDIYGESKWALSTYQSRRSLVDNYISPIIGNVNLSDVTPRFIDRYYQQMLTVKAVIRSNHRDNGTLVSPRNVREIHKVLSCAFNQAVKWEYIGRNPTEHANLPKHEPQKREIWTAEEYLKAIEVCEDDLLSLCMQLAFSGSLRIGEITGLTWDCVDVSDEAIETQNAFIFVDKELTRVSRAAMVKLDNRDILYVFPAIMGVQGSTSLVLKTPKTASSVRKIWLPATIARLLQKTKRAQEELIELIGEEYHNYNLVVALPNGRPVEERLVAKAFRSLIATHGLPPVVFHSLRHTSTTYKLKLSGGDVKAVQGDTGHAQVKMVTEVYSHILDEDRRKNAVLFEQAFYQKPGTEPMPATQATEAETVQPTQETAEILLRALQQSPDLMNMLSAMLAANESSVIPQTNPS